jgi:hypothetical protein
MKELDDELRAALRRQDPPAGFANRVLQRASGPARHARAVRPDPVSTTAWRTFMRWAAAAAVVAALAGGMQYRTVLHEREERARGEAAKEQVLVALRIAGGKLHVVQARIKEIGS